MPRLLYIICCYNTECCWLPNKRLWMSVYFYHTTIRSPLVFKNLNTVLTLTIGTARPDLIIIYTVYHSSSSLYITKISLYNFAPVKPHFHIVKLAFTGVYIIFLTSAQNINYGYSLEPSRTGEAVLTSIHNLCFEQKYEKYQIFYLKTFRFWWWNFQYIWIDVFS